MIYDLRGRLVKSLVNGHMDAGYHSVVWNGSNAAGRSLSSGIYIYQITAGDFVKSFKMAYMK